MKINRENVRKASSIARMVGQYIQVHNLGTLNQALKRLNIEPAQFARVLDILNTVRAKSKRTSIIRAVGSILDDIPPLVARQWYLPLSKPNIMGVNNGTIKLDRGIPIVMVRVVPRTNFAEIFDELTGKFCGIVDRGDLIDLSDKRKLRQRVSILKSRRAKVKTQEEIEQEKETERLAAVVKERNLARQEQDRIAKEKERQEKQERKARRTSYESLEFGAIDLAKMGLEGLAGLEDLEADGNLDFSDLLKDLDLDLDLDLI